MFKIIKFNCCGLDVHKTWIYACIGITDAAFRTEYFEDRFSSFPKDLRRLAAWLQEHKCEEVCMESSGKYWIPVFNALEQTCKVTLAHPKYTKPQKGNKTDRKDARWICDLFMCGMIKPSFIPHPGEHFDVTPFIDKRCKTPVDVIQNAVDGAISPEQAVKLRECLNHIDELSAHRDNIEKEILELVKPFSAQLALIRTVPGLDKDPMTAITILSEIGSDMSVFPTAKNLVSWAGCCPRNDMSAKHVKSTRIAAAGSFLKPILVQVANALIKSTKHPEFTERYRRIKSHRGHKKAMIALCKMFLTAIWNILSTGEVYNPSGYILQSPRPVDVKKVLTQKQALELLRLRGFTIVDDSSPQAAPA